MKELLSKIGAIIGNANDRHFAPDSRSEQTLSYCVINRVSSFLYTLPDRPF